MVTKTWRMPIVSLVLTAAAMFAICPSAAQAAEDEPLVWPTVRYSRIQRLAAGVAFQPRSPVLNRLVITATAGRGGYMAGMGIGSFGDDIMGGAAVHATWLRTTGRPRQGDPHETYLGIEGEIMMANISLRGGPMFRAGRSSTGSSRLLVGFSVGYGF